MAVLDPASTRRMALLRLVRGLVLVDRRYQETSLLVNPSSYVQVNRLLWDYFQVNPKHSSAAEGPAPSSYFLNKSPPVARVSSPAHLPSINLEYPNMKAIFGDPPVFEIHEVFSSELCIDYISRAEKFGAKTVSQTFNSNSGSKRTSTTWFLPYKRVPELLAFASGLTGLPETHFEEPQVVPKYTLGLVYSSPHIFFLLPMIMNAANTGLIFLCTSVIF